MITGDLRLDGRRTRLRLYDEKPFAHQLTNSTIRGNLVDGSFVTLLDCVPEGVHIRSTADGDVISTCTVFPHYVIEGARHFDHGIVRGLSALVEDASVLFADFGAYGTISSPGPEIMEAIAEHQREQYGWRIRIGPDPQIAYFSGNRLIAEVSTELGLFRAYHRPIVGFSNQSAEGRENQVWISIDLPDSTDFHQGLNRMTRCIRFLELLVGREQSVNEMYVITHQDPVYPPLRVRESYGIEPESQVEEGQFGRSRDLLLDPVLRSEEFASVLRNWIALDAARLSARTRFEASMAKGGSYSIDRLVGAANMFDILPEDAVPADEQPPAGVSEAKDGARKLFRDLPQSYERDAVLNSLGRIGKPTLKSKVRHRCSVIQNAAQEMPLGPFHYLDRVLEEAINVRNYFVHGTPPKLEIKKVSEFLPFLTDSLEFVFGASDLLDAGWDMIAWGSSGTTMAHPFGRYRVNYSEQRHALVTELKDTPDDDEVGSPESG